MPSDIRSFFGGKPPAAQPVSPAPKASTTKKSRASRKVLEDSDDDIPVAKPAVKPAPKKKEPTPEGEATSKDEYFGKGKPKRSEPAKKSVAAVQGRTETPKQSPAKPKATPQSRRSQGSTKTTPNGRSLRKTASVNYDDDSEMTEIKVLDDEEEGGDDIYAADFKPTGRDLDDFDNDEASSEDDVKPKRRSLGKAPPRKNKDTEEDYKPDPDVEMRDIDAEDDGDIEIDKPQKPARTTNGRKRKSAAMTDDDEDDDTAPSKSRGSGKKTPSKKSPAKKVKKEEVKESAEIEEIMASIPLVRPPTPPGEGSEMPKFKFGGHANSGPAPAEGSKEIPVGAENCLAGLTFVFTGLLESLSREQGQELVKRYGGKCTLTPSGKTSFVVLGSEAGPKKLEVIAKNNLKTINEDGLFELIRRLPANGGDSKAGTAHAEKQRKELERIKEEAAQQEKADQMAARAATAKAAQQTRPPSKKINQEGPDGRLWTVKYAPSDVNQICGNKTKVEVLQRWLRNFPKNQKRGFKMGGSDGTGIYRSVIISGPPGIGKTTAAHLVARLEGYDIVESNASDARSKKLVDTGLRGVLDTTSLLGYFAGEGEKAEKSKKKLVLIMDEVDGMSSGDRGGSAALAALCRKTSIPMILICNDRKLPKMKVFDHICYNMPFIRPTTEMIRSRIMTIAFREGMKLPPQVINALIEGTGADIRQVVNMLSTAKLDAQHNEQDLSFDDSKKMSKAWEKFTILKPWDTIHKILSTGMFSPSSTSTLNDKIGLYFNDHSLSYLMLQENYLYTTPSLANNYQGREQRLKKLELAEKAADSISEGDLVDRMIHGSQQQWSLMPTHALMSFVRPASFVAGSMAGHQSSFPAWMGKNSTQGKLMRMVKEIQGHMRLRCSADRHAIRQYYLPQLWLQMVKKLEVEGKDSVPEVIDLMDSYYLTKEDWEAIMELGVGPMDQEKVKLETQTKATFTRLYNQQSHPLPFMKASTVTAPRKQAKEKPDLEEAIDESDEAEFIDDAKGDDEDEADDLDLSKDKYVKAPSKKKASAKGKGRKSAGNEEDYASDDVGADGKGKKGKSAAKGKGKK